MASNPTPLGEVWMILKDPKQLAKLMAIQGVSNRKLAKVAGWDSHTYVNRLLKGEARTLRVDPAVRIAHYLGVGTDDLFLTGTSTTHGQTGKRKKAAAPARKNGRAA